MLLLIETQMLILQITEPNVKYTLQKDYYFNEHFKKTLTYRKLLTQKTPKQPVKYQHIITILFMFVIKSNILNVLELF